MKLLEQGLAPFYGGGQHRLERLAMMNLFQMQLWREQNMLLASLVGEVRALRRAHGIPDEHAAPPQLVPLTVQTAPPPAPPAQPTPYGVTVQSAPIYAPPPQPYQPPGVALGSVHASPPQTHVIEAQIISQAPSGAQVQISPGPQSYQPTNFQPGQVAQLGQVFHNVPGNSGVQSTVIIEPAPTRQ